MGTNEDEKKVRKRNTEIVMNALKTLEPVTLNEIVRHISTSEKVDAAQIKEPVKQVLERGIKYGFIEKVGTKYALQTASLDESEDDAEVVEASRRRRRRRRSRSRSRRRRSRSRRRR